MDDARDYVKRYLPLLKLNWLPIALGLSGLIFFIYGLIALLSLSSNKREIVLEQAGFPKETTKENLQSITVDIEGAVVKPGIYTLKQGARAQEALVLALGLSENADRNWVEKNLNLASKLSDGAKIYIPRAGELQNSATSYVQGVASDGNIASVGSLINVNTATSSELDTLPGVGPATAQKIISNRPYATVDELLSKKSVNSKVFSQIKEKVSVN